MGRLEDRLKKLEAKHEATRKWVVPLYSRAYLKFVNRLQAVAEGKEPPPFEDDELEYYYQADLEQVAGFGPMRRDTPGWRSPDAQAMIDAWELQALARVQAHADGVPLRELYERPDGLFYAQDEGGDEDTANTL